MDLRSAACHSWNESHLVPIVQGCLLALERTNLLAVYEHIDVMLDPAISLAKLLFEARETRLQVLDQCDHVRSLGFHPWLAGC